MSRPGRWVINESPGKMGDHELWFVLADHSHDVAPQLEVVGEVPVLITQELDFLDAKHARCRFLLFLADSRQLGVLLVGILTALRTVGDDDVSDISAVLGELGNRPAG